MIQPIKIDTTSFKRKSVIKTEWLNGNVPLKKGFLGGDLTPENATLDHALAKSKGGRSRLSNYLIMTAENNNKKADKDIFEFATEENTKAYFKAFEGTRFDKYTGEDYLKMLSNTLRELWEQSPIVKHLEMWEVLKRY